MGLVEKVKSDMVMAMKNKESKLSTLRLLLAELEKEKVSLKLSDVKQLSEQQVESVISRQIKKLDKEIEAYLAVNRDTSKQKAEKEILLSYLPKQLSESEIKEEVSHAINLVVKGEIDNPMKYLSQKLKGKADMKLVSEIVKEFSK